MISFYNKNPSRLEGNKHSWNQKEVHEPELTVMVVGQNGSLPRKTLESALPENMHLEFCHSAKEATQIMGIHPADALVILNHELLPLIGDTHASCSILFSPDAEKPAVRKLALQMGVQNCLKLPSQLDALDNLLISEEKKLHLH
jgi:hypothetical protein